jgi:hypothetical protein
VGVVEGTMGQAATAGMATCASGGFISFQPTEVLSSEQMDRVLKPGSAVAGSHRAPH